MPNTLRVDAGYMTRMRRCWAYVRLVAVRVPQVIRTVRKDRWEVPHAFRVGRIGWMFQMVPLPISTGRSKLWMLTRWWSEGTSRCTLDIRALADTEPDEWLRELGRRKIDSLVVDDDDVFEMLSSI